MFPVSSADAFRRRTNLASFEVVMLAETILADFIGQIYGAAIGNEDWEAVLGRLSEILGGRRTVFRRFHAPHRPPAAEAHPLPVRAATARRRLPPQLPIGTVFIGGVPVPEATGAGSVFYHDVLKPRGLLTGLYRLGFDRNGSAAVLILCRPKHGQGWSKEQLSGLCYVAPHLDRALDIERRLAATDIQRAAGALPTAPGALTQRERDCLLLVARGASNKEAARRLGLSIYTVEGHVKSVIRKLQATSRTGAVATALALGLLNG
jgi:DNA-binding CsgD family transcriptional regulator